MNQTTANPAAFRLLSRLAKNRAGNTIAMMAAAILPLLAMIGGGIDMGRSYLAQARLQQACDSGVLAARKKLGSQVATNGVVPASASAVGNRFFNLNFGAGDYSTINRNFTMTLQPDNSVEGDASVVVPTSVMQIFGYSQVPIAVHCQAQLNFSNTDIMFVLDNTGSMNDTNPGDTVPKIQALKDTVKNFYTQVEASKGPGTRIRYGFVPYSTNVNVGYLLKSDWVVDKWQYQGRVSQDSGNTESIPIYNTSSTYISGTVTNIAAYTASSCPSNTTSATILSSSTDSSGVTTTRYQIDGTSYNCSISTDGSQVQVTGTVYNAYVYDYSQQQTGTTQQEIYNWSYQPVTEDVTVLKNPNGNLPLVGGSIDVPMYGYPSANPGMVTANFRGCMEERDTYEIADYNNVDLTKALDLDIDLVPTKGVPSTQWRPMLNEISWERQIWWDGTGNFTQPNVVTTDDYLMAQGADLSACPAQAQKLQEMAPTDVDNYLNTLVADGSTYHDIGMIWGGRLLSPTGIFASDNADVNGMPTRRNLIFLTDGLTEPLDLSYATYGIEPLDQRRWNPQSPAGGYTLTQVVENRFTFACNEVKKRNITIWVVSFGVTLNPVLANCAGPGHAFSAANATDLNTIFSNIAKNVGDLRISK